MSFSGESCSILQGRNFYKADIWLCGYLGCFSAYPLLFGIWLFPPLIQYSDPLINKLLGEEYPVILKVH